MEVLSCHSKEESDNGPYWTHRLPAQGASREGLGVAWVEQFVFFGRTRQKPGYSELNLRHWSFLASFSYCTHKIGPSNASFLLPCPTMSQVPFWKYFSPDYLGVKDRSEIRKGVTQGFLSCDPGRWHAHWTQGWPECLREDPRAGVGLQQV